MTLTHLIEHLQYGVVEKGNRGEIIARLVLLFAFDELVKNDGFASTPTLKRFLWLLLGLKDEPIQEYKNLEDDLPVHCESFSYLSDKKLSSLESLPLDGLLNFSHFVGLQDAVVTEEYLKECFLRQAAIVFETGRWGADMLIPIMHKDGSMTGLFVQVKNRKDDTLLTLMRSDEVTFKLSTEYVMKANEYRDVAYPAILLALGSSDDFADVSLVKSFNLRHSKSQRISRLPVVVICGFKTFSFLTNEEKKKMIEILDFIVRVPNEVRQCVPLIYNKN
jgi:hypothetical protein